jgi:hypothetical protein
MAIAPFLKESFLGDDSITVVVRKNKVATVLLVANTILLALLLFMTTEASKQYMALKEERIAHQELQGVVETLLPSGITNQDTVMSLGRKISELESDRLFYAERLNEAYLEIDKLTASVEFIEKVCVPDTQRRDNVLKSPAPEPKPKPPVQERMPAINLRELLNSIEEGD